MNVYTYTEARQKLATLLEQAAREGEVKIRRKGGQTSVPDGMQAMVRPERRAGSPLDVTGLDLGVTADEIVQCVREGRRTDCETGSPTAAGETDARSG